MCDKTTIVDQLQAIDERIHQERASLSIMGRGLRPEEEARLAALSSAETHLDTAINDLRGAQTGGHVDLPDDGRYSVGNDVLAVELRIDLALTNIVSADVFALAQGHREYLASLRSEPGETLTRTSNALSIVAEDREGHRSRGRLEVTAASGDEVTVLLAFDSQLTGLPVSQVVTLAGRRRGAAMRELGLELETEQGVDADPVWQLDGREITIESALQDAGLEVIRVGRRDQIPTPSSSGWDLSQLHGLMSQFAQEPIDREVWNLHLLLLNKSSTDRLLGIMFDSGDRDANQLPRQGVAVFIDPMRNRSDFKRKLIQTTVHELGHALNLAHRFERPVGRADSTSFMNYDWKYLGGGNEQRFWREFSFTFDADELAFLRHGPWENVIPGGAEFHTIPYWNNTDGGYVPYVPEVPSSDFSIALSAPQNDGLFQFAQPVLLTVSLTNNSGRTMDLPKFLLDPKAGLVEFVVQRRTSPASGGGRGDGAVFRPIARRCFDMEPTAADIVPHGGKLVNNVNLTFGSAGFTFAEPGDYQVTAYFVWQKRRGDVRTIKSAPIPIRIAYPKTDDEEREGLDLFRWDVGYYFALGGSDVLTDAEGVLQKIVDRRQAKDKPVSDPLVANIRRCQAMNKAREFVQYAKGKFKTRSAEPDKAHKLLTSIGGVLGKVFDPETERSTAALTEALKKAMKK